ERVYPCARITTPAVEAVPRLVGDGEHLEAAGRDTLQSARRLTRHVQPPRKLRLRLWRRGYTLGFGRRLLGLLDPRGVELGAALGLLLVGLRIGAPRRNRQAELGGLLVAHMPEALACLGVRLDGFLCILGGLDALVGVSLRFLRRQSVPPHQRRGVAQDRREWPHDDAPDRATDAVVRQYVGTDVDCLLLQVNLLRLAPAASRR